MAASSSTKAERPHDQGIFGLPDDLQDLIGGIHVAKDDKGNPVIRSNSSCKTIRFRVQKDEKSKDTVIFSIPLWCVIASETFKEDISALGMFQAKARGGRFAISPEMKETAKSMAMDLADLEGVTDEQKISELIDLVVKYLAESNSFMDLSGADWSNVIIPTIYNGDDRRVATDDEGNLIFKQLTMNEFQVFHDYCYYRRLYESKESREKLVAEGYEDDVPVEIWKFYMEQFGSESREAGVPAFNVPPEISVNLLTLANTLRA